MYRVLHIGEYVKGGVATYLHILFQAPAEELEQFLLLSRDNSDQTWELPASHVRFYDYQRGLRYLPAALRAVRCAVRDWQPDIVYCHSSWAGAFGRAALAGLTPRPRVLYNAHGWAFLRDTADWKQDIYAWVERWLARRTDAIICVSRYEYDSALSRALPAKKLKLVYSGLPEDGTQSESDTQTAEQAGFVLPAAGHEMTLSAKEIHLLFIGRWDPPKGLDLLLTAFLACPRPDLRLYVLGAGVVEQGDARSQQLQHLVQRAREDQRITFVGWVEHADLAQWYAACDAVIMPSRWEAFGLVAAEALQHARPVLASTRGALPELIHEGENGHLFTLERTSADCGTAVVDAADADTLDMPTLGQLLAQLNKAELQGLRVAARTSYEQHYTATHLWRNMMEIYSALPTMGGRTDNCTVQFIHSHAECIACAAYESVAA